MPTPPLSDEVLTKTVECFNYFGGNQVPTAKRLGIARQTLQNRLKHAAERGMMGTKPVLPGFRISQTTETPSGTFVQQKPERGPEFELPAGHTIKGVSALVDESGREIIKWVKSATDQNGEVEFLRAVAEGFRANLPRAEPLPAPRFLLGDLLCQYTITDLHLGALAWNEETGGGDYDLAIGERLLTDWFRVAIACSPPAKRAVFAQLGDFLHYDSFKSVTPEHGHILDADTRYPKMVRAAIRVMRAVIRMLLEKHEHVHLVIADANHDPAGEVWLREMFATFFEEEPRVTVDSSPGAYSYVEHGQTSLFFHHGHRRNTANVDSVFVGRFREVYGRTRFSYAHQGHKHEDELRTTNLMKVEQHETLAAPDAYSANSGWLSGRSAKVITYSAKYGEVGRQVINATMVADMVRGTANDNGPAAAEKAA